MLVKITNDVWIQSGNIIAVEKNTTTNAVEVSYFCGTGVAMVSIAGTTVDKVAEAIKGSQ